MQIDYEFIQRNWLEGNYGYSEFLPQTLQPINTRYLEIAYLKGYARNPKATLRSRLQGQCQFILCSLTGEQNKY